MTHFRVYDVFTETLFGGNQLAVITDATHLPEAALQSIAREFNYSETTFIYPPDDTSNTAKVRIFTPTTEIAFAGHPIIGTAIALSDLGYPNTMTLELGVGPIACTVSGNAAAFDTAIPLETLSRPDPALTAAALSLPISALRGIPVQATLGLPFVIVEIDSVERLSACQPSIDHIREGAGKYPAGLDFALFVYVQTGNRIDARMFAPLDNIPEDPATGSACATLTALLTQTHGPKDLTIHQGVDMGRPSIIKATSTIDPVVITISGQAVLTMQGTLVL